MKHDDSRRIPMANNDELDEIRELSAGRRLVCNISAAAIVLLAGLFLLLCGCGVINADMKKAVCGTLLFALGLIFLVSALVGKNSVSLWLSFCFFVPALVELLVKTTKLGYAELYPLYIAVPAIASFFTMLFTHEWFSHAAVIGVFGVPAGIFALQSGGVASWPIAGAVLVLYAGCLMLAIALKRRKKDNENDN